MTPKYFDALEAEWTANGGNVLRDADELRLDTNIRGADLRRLLINLHFLVASTGDSRFADAGKALDDHGLVDGHGRWRKDFRPPIDAAMDRERFDMVEALRQDGRSIKEAAAIVAARTGEKANSFSRAVDRIREIHRRVGEEVQH